jgi:hypothetical protein
MQQTEIETAYITSSRPAYFIITVATISDLTSVKKSIIPAASSLLNSLKHGGYYATHMFQFFLPYDIFMCSASFSGKKQPLFFLNIFN